ncbi:hypothetical protein UFOVP67_48 [uncultured Caudovirales phage]|uniref:Uncharacterized protein n=1 Tax=uncultured Caudovirales phage TaxID=2100421 RepID=A0A6J5T9B3_9CAUD|nr:hypothetical protein UFOVP67_48 [uncultured Caudovirales phage]
MNYRNLHSLCFVGHVWINQEALPHKPTILNKNKLYHNSLQALENKFKNPLEWSHYVFFTKTHAVGASRTEIAARLMLLGYNREDFFIRPIVRCPAKIVNQFRSKRLLDKVIPVSRLAMQQEVDMFCTEGLEIENVSLSGLPKFEEMDEILNHPYKEKFDEIS